MSFTLHRTFQYLGIILIFSAIGGGYWYWKVSRAAQTVESDTPSFEAPLTHTLDLSRGIGVPTYSRADGADRRATVTDFEGLIRPVKQNEARFEGARRVENLITYSEDFGNAVWSKDGTTPATVTTNQINAPDGTLTADLLDISPASDSRISYTVAGTNIANTTYVVSVWLRAVSGSGTWPYTYRKTDGTSVSGTFALTTVWQRFSVTIPAVNSAAFATLFWVGNRGGGGTLTQAYAWGAQLENVTGQANQNPSEYVSTNVKTAFPYHGAGVDGVKYFDTQNGNTVASNVVTEATGAKIASTTLKGYLAEGSRTNLALRSEEFNDANWSKVASGVMANTVAAPSGSTVADKLTEDATNAAHYVTGNSVSITSGLAYTVSVYAKSAENSKIGLWLTGSYFPSAGRHAWFDLSSGTVGGAQGGVTASIVSTGNGWYRCQITVTATGTGSVGFGGLYLTQGGYGDAYGGTNGNGVHVWGAQLEQAAFASSYIPTTSTSVTRASDSLSYPETGNFNDTIGTVSLETTPNWTGGLGWNAHWVADSSNGYKLRIWHWNGLANHTGVDRSANNGSTRNQTDPALTLTNGTMIKIATKWDGTALRQFNNGALAVSDTTLTLPYDSLTNSLFIGSANTIDHAFSSIKNVRAWKKALTDTEMNNLTSLTQATSDSAVKETIVKTPSNTGLVGYWSFEDGSGTRAEDFSPTGTNTGTLTNGPTWVDGKIGKAVNFDGVNDYVAAIAPASLDSPSQITVSAWVKSDTTYSGNPNGIVSHMQTSAPYNGFEIGYNQTIPYFHAGGTYVSNNLMGTTSLVAGVWNHVVGTYDGAVSKIYINGILENSSARTNNLAISGEPVDIGVNYDRTRYWDGQIDDVRLYDRALSASEIAGLYAQGNMGKTTVNTSQNNQLTSGLVGLWSFNGPDLSGTTAYDRSGQGNNGTLVNGPSVYPGKVGQGLRFDGSNDYVDTNNNSSADDLEFFTYSAWIYRSDNSADYILSKLSNGGGSENFWVESDTLRVVVANSSGPDSGRAISTNTLPVEEWVYVAATYSNSGDKKPRLYINGSEVSYSEQDSLSGLTLDPDSNADFEIGRRATGSNYFKGRIDEVRIYNRSLSAAEVAALYQMGR